MMTLTKFKPVVLLLLIHFCTSHCFRGFCVCFVFSFALLGVFSSFAIILTRKRELVALLNLSSWCLVTVSSLWLFLAVPWVGL